MRLAFSLLALALSANSCAELLNVTAEQFSAEVTVEKSAENSWKAKELALEEARSVGVRSVVKKLCLSRDCARALDALSHCQNLVHYVKFCKESSYQNTFTATVRVYLEISEVHKAFEESRIPFSLQGPRQCLVLVFVDEAADRLAIEQSWLRHSSPNGLVYVQRFEGLQERLLWQENQSAEGREKIIEHYRMAYPDALLISAIYSRTEGGQGYALVVNTETGGEISHVSWNSSDYDRLVEHQSVALQDWWKGQSFVRGWEKKEVQVVHDVRSIQGWHDFCQSILKNPTVSKSEIKSLNCEKGVLNVTVLKNYRTVHWSPADVEAKNS